tara:strand:+ start:28011 stop:28727 length:717 start_codon:yes stop_codon:yes gene_type:complete
VPKAAQVINKTVNGCRRYNETEVNTTAKKLCEKYERTAIRCTDDRSSITITPELVLEEIIRNTKSDNEKDQLVGNFCTTALCEQHWAGIGKGNCTTYDVDEYYAPNLGECQRLCRIKHIPCKTEEMCGIIIPPELPSPTPSGKNTPTPSEEDNPTPTPGSQGTPSETNIGFIVGGTTLFIGIVVAGRIYVVRTQQNLTNSEVRNGEGTELTPFTPLLVTDAGTQTGPYGTGEKKKFNR